MDASLEVFFDGEIFLRKMNVFFSILFLCKKIVDNGMVGEVYWCKGGRKWTTIKNLFMRFG